MKRERQVKNEDNVGCEENGEFHSSLLGRLIDTIIFQNTGLPTDLLWEKKKLERPLNNVLAGKINDPLEAQKIEESYRAFGRRLKKYLQKKTAQSNRSKID